MEKIIWTDHVKTEEVLHTVKKERNNLHTLKEESVIGLATPCIGTAF